MATLANTFTKSLLAASLAVASGSVLAAQGDFIVRAGLAHVAPNADSDSDILGIPGAEVDVDSDTSLGLTFGYMATDNIGIGLLAAWPFEHDIEGDGSISGLDDVASTKHLPPTVTAQWHFMPENNIRPFVGAGINYTYFFDEDTEGALETLDINLHNSWGWAAEAGVDIDLNDQVFFGAQVFYIDIATEAKISGAEQFDVDIDPWVFLLTAGTRF